jgi:hypothetical protein
MHRKDPSGQAPTRAAPRHRIAIDEPTRMNQTVTVVAIPAQGRDSACGVHVMKLKMNMTTITVFMGVAICLVMLDFYITAPAVLANPLVWAGVLGGYAVLWVFLYAFLKWIRKRMEGP